MTTSGFRGYDHLAFLQWMMYGSTTHNVEVLFLEQLD